MGRCPGEGCQPHRDLTVTPSAEPAPHTWEAPNPPSGLAIAAGAQFAALIASTVIAVAFLVDRGADGKGTALKPGVAPVVLSLVPLWACLIGGVFIAGRLRNVPVRALVGLRIRPADPLYLVLGVLLQFAGTLLYLPFSVDSDRLERPARELVGRAGRLGPSFVVLAIALVVVAPAVEELFYRGLVLGSIRRVLDGRSVAAAPVLAVVLGAVWFAGVHFEWLQFPALLLVGLVCGAIATRCGRIAPSFFTHVGFNLVTVFELGRRLR